MKKKKFEQNCANCGNKGSKDCLACLQGYHCGDQEGYYKWTPKQVEP